jgi:hypothetical protein
VETQRVELANGQWAVLRTTPKVRDGVEREAAQRERGPNPLLDSVLLLRQRITAWSFGDEVTDDGVQDLDDEDALTLLQVLVPTANDTPDPNASSPSRSGGRRRTKAEVDPQSSGG